MKREVRMEAEKTDGDIRNRERDRDRSLTQPGHATRHPRGLAGWLLGKLNVIRRTEPRLAVLERIALAPRQSLALVEAEGRRFLVATSPEGTPAFYPLDRTPAERASKAAKRVSW
jgi:hypothetical protein